MPLTYPLNLPLDWCSAEVFELQRVDLLTGAVAGRTGGVSLGPPLWGAQWTIGRVRPSKSDELRAFIAALRGPLMTFRGFDQRRRFPRAYPKGSGGMTRAGGGAFDSAATGWSVNTSRDVLTLTGFPAGYVFSPGDYVGFVWFTGGQERRALVRSLEAANASGGGVLAISVEPAVPSLVPPAALAFVDTPSCLMRLVPDGTQIGPSGPLGAITGTIAAVQDLRP